MVILKDGSTLISEYSNCVYTKIQNDPYICNWLETYSGYTFTPLEKLKAIPIQEKMIYDKLSADFGPNPESCGMDDNSLLTETEAIFLNEYLKGQAQLKEFDFSNKKIIFVTGSSGRKLGTKTGYFDSVKKWKVSHNEKIASSLLLLSEEEKTKYGFDAILTYWVKVIDKKSMIKILEQAS